MFVSNLNYITIFFIEHCFFFLFTHLQKRCASEEIDRACRYIYIFTMSIAQFTFFICFENLLNARALKAARGLCISLCRKRNVGPSPVRLRAFSHSVSICQWRGTTRLLCHFDNFFLFFFLFGCYAWQKRAEGRRMFDTIIYIDYFL